MHEYRYLNKQSDVRNLPISTFTTIQSKQDLLSGVNIVVEIYSEAGDRIMLDKLPNNEISAVWLHYQST